LTNLYFTFAANEGKKWLSPLKNKIAEHGSNKAGKRLK